MIRARSLSIPRRLSLQAIVRLLLFGGLVLLPFSTGAGANSVVVAFGLPFLGLAGLLIGLLVVTGKLRFAPALGPAVIVAAAQLCVMAALTLAAPNIVAAAARVVTQMIGFMIFVYIISFAHSPRHKRPLYTWMSHLLTLSGTLLAAYFLLHALNAVRQKGMSVLVLERTIGSATALPWGASNTIAATLTIPLFVTLSRLHSERPQVPWIDRIAVLVIPFAILTTLSRTAILVIAFAFTLLGLFKKSFRSVFLVGFVALLGVGVVAVQNDVLREFFSTRLSNTRELLSFNGRVDIWRDSLRFFMTRPFAPIGYYGSLYLFGRTSHNVLLTTLLEQGIVGVVSLILLLGTACAWSLRAMLLLNGARRSIAGYYFCGMVAIVSSLQLEDANFTQQYIIYFWIFLGLLFLSTYAFDQTTNTADRGAPTIAPAAA